MELDGLLLLLDDGDDETEVVGVLLGTGSAKEVERWEEWGEDDDDWNPSWITSPLRRREERNDDDEYDEEPHLGSDDDDDDDDADDEEDEGSTEDDSSVSNAVSRYCGWWWSKSWPPTIRSAERVRGEAERACEARLFAFQMRTAKETFQTMKAMA